MPLYKNSFCLASTLLLGVALTASAQTGSNTPPFGWLDSQSSSSVFQNTTILVSGWAADQEDGSVTKVQILLDGNAVGNAMTGLLRPDVSTALNDPRYANSGWSLSYSIGTLSLGQHTLIAVAYDSTGANSQLQGIARFAVTSTPPFGWLDSQSASSVFQNTTIQVSGWAADQEDGSAAKVQVLLDGSIVIGTASLGAPRPDVSSALSDPRYANSGWSLGYNVGSLSLGQHSLIAVAYDSTGASSQLQGVAAFTVSSTPPFGWLDSQSASRVVQNNTVQVSGWAADQEDGAPISRVDIILDGGAVVGNAILGFSRPDVSTYFNDPRYAASGWSFTYNVGSLSSGQHTLTAKGYDSTGANAPLQGSAAITVIATNSGAVTPTANPQVAAYSITAPAGSSVSVDFGPDQSYGLQTSQFPAPVGGGTVQVLVAGMKSNSQYHMRAAVHASDGTVTYDTDQTFTTSSYDSSLMPPITVTHFNQSAEAPGVQMLDCVKVGQFDLFVVDRDGNLIWAYQNPADVNTSYDPAKQLPNGNFLILAHNIAIREVDLAGTTVNEITQDQVNSAMVAAGYQFGTITLHHDLQKLSNGHFVLLGQITRNVTLTGDSSPTAVTGDILIDVDPNLNIAWVWNSFDHLDVNRHPFSKTDWTHSNAVVLTADGNLLLSMRHQSWILKIDYQNGAGTGNVLWRLGYQGDFALQSSNGVIDWFYMQHYPNILSEQNGIIKLAVFDNGDNRVLDAGGDMCGTTGQIACYSRAVVVDVDQNSMTASLEYQHTLSQYSFWGGSIQQMPNGNFVAGMSATTNGSRAEEFTGDASQTPVWQMDVDEPNASMYRSLRLPSLYPGVTWP